MQCDKEKREVTQAGLLEKYVLGLCNASEKGEIEKLIKSNPEIAERIGKMQKAVKCYCTSCHSNKVKSILRGKNKSVANSQPEFDDRKVDLSQTTDGVIGKTLAYIRELLPIKL